MSFLKGKKTYIVAGLIVIYVIVGLILGDMPKEKAIELVLESMGLAGLRHAVA